MFELTTGTMLKHKTHQQERENYQTHYFIISKTHEGENLRSSSRWCVLSMMKIIVFDNFRALVGCVYAVLRDRLNDEYLQGLFIALNFLTIFK